MGDSMWKSDKILIKFEIMTFFLQMFMLFDIALQDTSQGADGGSYPSHKH